MADIELMNKDELREYAKKEFGVTLDMRKSIETLKEELSNVKPVTLTKAVKPKQVEYLKNPVTGLWWPYSALLEQRGDLTPCDENGNDLI